MAPRAGKKAPAKRTASMGDAPLAAATGAGGAEPRVIPFYSDKPGKKFREFSNFFRDAPPFKFRLPAFARREGLPEAVDCEFSEKAIMLTKAALMGDTEAFAEIERAADPRSCKSLGRGVRGWDQKLWDEHLEEVAFEVVRQKFEANCQLRELLLSTGTAILAEAAHNDCIWGIGLGTGDDRAFHPEQWQGRNVLGHALMRARSHLRGETASATVAPTATENTSPLPPALPGGEVPRSPSLQKDTAPGAQARARRWGSAAAAAGAAAASAADPHVILFWRDWPGHEFREFSNFFRDGSSFTFRLPAFTRREGLPEAVDCEFSEKAIMLTKAALMGDAESFAEIVAAADPRSCWAAGRGVRGFNQELWDQHLEEVAFEVVRQKFEASHKLRELLLSTGTAVIAEASPKDRIWGIGLGASDERALHPEQWEGRNVLGRTLMRVRSHLRGATTAMEPGSTFPASSGTAV